MPVARITEISASSTKSFEDAVKVGVARASQTLDKIKSAWVKDQQVRVKGGEIVEYQVLLKVTFVLKD